MVGSGSGRWASQGEKPDPEWPGEAEGGKMAKRLLDESVWGILGKVGIVVGILAGAAVGLTLAGVLLVLLFLWVILPAMM